MEARPNQIVLICAGHHVSNIGYHDPSEELSLAPEVFRQLHGTTEQCPDNQIRSHLVTQVTSCPARSWQTFDLPA